MIDETIVKQAATRHGQPGNLVALYLWFSSRILIALVTGLLVINLLYRYFFLPDGLAGISYSMITTRWVDPQWGVLWRVFDWLVVVVGVMVGAQMLRPSPETFGGSPAIGKLIQAVLTIFYLLIISLAAQIIFGFSL